MLTISIDNAKKMMEKSNGKIFTVCFIKKTDGTYREMNARIGVTKGVTGQGKKFNDADYGLLTVYDMQKRAFRSVSLRNIVALRTKGNQYKVQA